jgi:beta-phosphoglucomutase-like phosphatase (HAD superfamily)
LRQPQSSSTPEPLASYLAPDEAGRELERRAAQLGSVEFARVRNLEYVFSPFELYPLAARVVPPLDRIVAFAVDMDGTSTTTEPLALHALEYMVRRLTGRMTPADWPGLDRKLDYPFVIGNSNFRHTEFLVRRYRDRLHHESFRQAFFEALVWTLANIPDTRRRREVEQNARNCGLRELLVDAEFQRLAGGGEIPFDRVGTLVEPLIRRFGAAFTHDNESDRVSAALDIYYLRYHHILDSIARGEGDRLSRELLGTAGRRLVEPMPGYEVFVPLVKGCLGPAADALYESLREYAVEHSGGKLTRGDLDRLRPRLPRLAEQFRRSPAKLALVTASIRYEAEAVMHEILRQIAARAAAWPIPAERHEELTARLADPTSVFDGFVTANDAHEARLKPHRDLYSIALFQMSIRREEYPLCVGLEDTEPGIIALRAAGVGCAVAMPNRDTAAQNYQAAVRVVHGGLPELILVHNCLLRDVP